MFDQAAAPVIENDTAVPPGCPMHRSAPRQDAVSPDEDLVFIRNRRTIVQYATDSAGARELRLYYDDKEISFDEPDLFPFGEALARQTRFVAKDATEWAPGLDWARVRGLLGELVEGGVLVRASTLPPQGASGGEAVRPSPLPPAPCPVARDWDAFEAITRELTGRAVELGYLELIVPIFRVAHIAVDAEGRQVGEANVFPRDLRVEFPIEWRTCNLPGSRFQSDRPMNVTAMRSMRAHWPQMMAAILRVRAAYLRRFPDADGAWTVGHIERLSTAVLAVPTYQVMRRHGRVANGDLHPALSSMFRVTDGVRMTMHQMLFIPIAEPALAPTAPMTVDEILDYAERNYSFHSDQGVCAGPRAMVRELLQVLIEGEAATDYTAVALDAPVRAALDDVDAALDYGLHGLRAYAAVFSLWPAMTRAYETIAALAETWGGDVPALATTLRARMRGHLEHIKHRSYLADEQWRIDREKVYADMYAQCGRGLSRPAHGPDLETLLAPAWTAEHEATQARLRGILRDRLGAPGAIGDASVEKLTSCIMGFLLRAQAMLRAGIAVQDQINQLLGRQAPLRPLSGADIDVHNLLQGAESRRLPYLVDELAEIFGMDIAFDADRLLITERGSAA